ncbi:pimelyl-ACP methyl ester esterase BioV [Hydrogenimonas urashimensis]|uniref:pimelyl-ACP methyl ester esterase BioV n=1 Tax=Hydrogenimonas urashimensis TaxID=2740515 RepID=UPI0019159A94|nr:pimelyl-ACP methyl ester esterase BioV [Hydrogenimonas urashimensis]
MIFFSGFSLKGEKKIFSEYLERYGKNPYVVAGFSYGAIRALEYAVASQKRIDRLILLSPAYFKEVSKAFVKTQMVHYRKDPDAYIEKFLANAASPASFDLDPFRSDSTPEELEELLGYEWPSAHFKTLLARGVKIETFLGGEDRIVDAHKAHRFFKRYTTSYLFKPFGHLLR